MFLLTPVCLRVCGCVCERETCLLLFPNLTSPLGHCMLPVCWKTYPPPLPTPGLIGMSSWHHPDAH